MRDRPSRAFGGGGLTVSAPLSGVRAPLPCPCPSPRQTPQSRWTGRGSCRTAWSAWTRSRRRRVTPGARARTPRTTRSSSTAAADPCRGLPASTRSQVPTGRPTPPDPCLRSRCGLFHGARAGRRDRRRAAPRLGLRARRAQADVPPAQLCARRRGRRRRAARAVRPEGAHRQARRHRRLHLHPRFLWLYLQCLHLLHNNFSAIRLTAARPPSRPSLAPRRRYVADQPDAEMQDHPRFLCLPGLGAATSEAADNAVQMAAKQLAQFLEQGTITSAPRNRSNHSNTNAPPD